MSEFPKTLLFLQNEAHYVGDFKIHHTVYCRAKADESQDPNKVVICGERGAEVKKINGAELARPVYQRDS